MATRDPSATSAWAVARPIPRAAPVMKTTLPARDLGACAISRAPLRVNVRMRTRYSFRFRSATWPTFRGANLRFIAYGVLADSIASDTWEEQHMPAARTFRIAGAMVSAVVLAGLAPAAAGAATPPPDVTSFTSSPTSLTPAAATVHLHVSITHATTCTFKSSPAITGSTAPFTCTSGSINRTAKVPANTGSTTRKYVFSINASGPGGTAGATLTMYQFPPTPTVDNYQASPVDPQLPRRHDHRQRDIHPGHDLQVHQLAGGQRVDGVVPVRHEFQPRHHHPGE